MAPFERWGTGHLSAIALTLLIPLVLAAWTRRDAGGRVRRAGELFFTAVLLGQAVWRPFWLHAIGALPPWYELVPLHLCDWALIACVVACLRRAPLAFELAYFWGLAGTLQGLITPDLDGDFPSPAFWLFFLGHGGIVGCVLFLSAGGAFRLRWTSVRRAFAGVCAYGAVAGGFNAIAGTNFGYTCRKPDVSTLLDHLGPWPWYMLSLLAVAAVNFVLLFLPWVIADRLRTCARRGGTGPTPGIND